MFHEVPGGDGNPQRLLGTPWERDKDWLRGVQRRLKMLKKWDFCPPPTLARKSLLLSALYTRLHCKITFVRRAPQLGKRPPYNTLPPPPYFWEKLTNVQVGEVTAPRPQSLERQSQDNRPFNPSSKLNGRSSASWTEGAFIKQLLDGIVQ